MSVDIVGVVAFVEEGLNRNFFVVANFAFVVQSDQFRGFTSEHTAINENKFPHEILVVLLILPPTMELQKKSIDALLESMAILRQELQNNQDSEKEIELLGELKLLSARIYIESDLAVMSMLPEMSEDLPDSLDEFDGQLVDAIANVVEEADTELDDSSVISSKEEDVAANEMEKDVAPKEEIPLQQDLFFAAVPVLGGQRNSSSIQDEVAKNAIEEDAVAKIANIDFDSPEFKLPEFELPEFELPEFDLEKVEVVSPVAEDELPEEVAVAVPPVVEVDSPLAEVVLPPPVDVVPAVTEAVPPVAEVVLPPLVDVVPAVTEVVPPAAEVTPQIPVEVIPTVEEEVISAAEEVLPVAEEVLPVEEEVISAAEEVPTSVVLTPSVEVVTAVTEVVPPAAEVVSPPPVEIVPPPISAINTLTESPVDSSSSVQLNENGELPPPALSGMNVEAIVNQMPISRRFEFANLLFGGDIQRMGTFIHELLQAPTGSGRMDVYERWYDENNWRRRDEAASDMLRLIKRIFPS